MAGSRSNAPKSFAQQIVALVCLIPRGRVLTYGRVAGYLGAPRAARAVGYNLAGAIGDGLPWHRVINARGEISVGGALWRPEEQRRLLIREGIVFSSRGAIDLPRYLFRPTARQLAQLASLCPR